MTQGITKQHTYKERIRELKAELGSRLIILTHHYQNKEIVELGNYVGDSFGLARRAASDTDAEFIVFCGVHFMAESAAILARPGQSVQIPDMEAGCWMADMADASESTDSMIKYVESASPGDEIVIGTEFNLIDRLQQHYRDRTVLPLSRSICPNMGRIDLPRLCHTLENPGRINVVTVEPEIREQARLPWSGCWPCRADKASGIQEAGKRNRSDRDGESIFFVPPVGKLSDLSFQPGRRAENASCCFAGPH